MKKLTLEEIKNKIDAGWIWDDGRFGVRNFQISSGDECRIKKGYGIVDLKTGEIIKEAK